MERVFTKKDFEDLNKLKLYGKLSQNADTELYWLSTIDREDAAFGQTMKTHHHDFFEIHFILGGKIVYVFGQTRAEADTGDMVIIPSGIPHLIKSYTSDMLKTSVAVRIGEADAIFKALCKKGCRSLKIDNYIADSIAFCAENASRSLFYKETLIKNRIFELLCNLAGECDSMPTLSDENSEISRFDMRLFKAKQFIKDNPSVFISCEELAKYCNLSSKQLNRIFLKYEHVSLLQYIHREKLDQAKKMLIESQLSASEISETLGFSSVYYFSRFFSKHADVSPSEYREKSLNRATQTI